MLDLPDQISEPMADMIRIVDEAGGAVMAFDADDRLVFANGEQRRIMPVCSYGDGETYASIFWAAFKSGFSGNRAAHDDPEAWLGMAVAARKASPSLDFVNTYCWGRAACTHIRDDDGISLQFRINLENANVEQYFGACDAGLGIVWALRVQQEMRKLKHALDSLGLSVALIDHYGRAVHQNASFSDLLDEADGIIVRDDGVLAATDPCDDLVVRQALDHVTGGAIPVSYVPLRRASGSPLIMAVSAGATAGTAVITVSRFGEDSKEIADTLRQVFAISPAEAEVMAALGTGQAVGDLAAQRGVAENTIYQQVRSIKGALRRSKFAAPSLAGAAGLVQRIAAITHVPRGHRH